jgi:hypothetical protein
VNSLKAFCLRSAAGLAVILVFAGCAKKESGESVGPAGKYGTQEQTITLGLKESKSLTFTFKSTP